MKFSKRFPFLGLMLGCLLSLTHCTDVFTNESESASITAVLQQDQFIVQNNYPFDIHIFAADEALLAVIDWIPVNTDGNLVERGATRVFDSSFIVGYKEGQPALLMYWDSEDRQVFNSIKIQVLE